MKHCADRAAGGGGGGCDGMVFLASLKEQSKQEHGNDECL